MENSCPKISVIVPVYNTEKYLCRCINSILAQDFTDFELILVDDGSKDMSGLICNEYAKKDNRVKVYHKENGGVSSARNLGLNKAQGEFIAFIDSDDYVDSDYFSILMSGGNADLIVTGYKMLDKHNNIIDQYNYSKSILSTRTDIANCLSKTLNQFTFRAPWCKLFSRDIIKRHAIYFNTQMKQSEDSVFLHIYLLYSNTIVLLNGIAYNYTTDTSSVYKRTLSESEYTYHINTCRQAYNNIAKHFNFRCIDFERQYNKDLLISYLRYISNRGYTLKGYSNFRHTMSQQCPPNISFSERFYIFIYKLLQKKLYFLSFLILKFIYPLKVHLIQNINQHKTTNMS